MKPRCAQRIEVEFWLLLLSQLRCLAPRDRTKTHTQHRVSASYHQVAYRGNAGDDRQSVRSAGPQTSPFLFNVDKQACRKVPVRTLSDCNHPGSIDCVIKSRQLKSSSKTGAASERAYCDFCLTQQKRPRRTELI